MIKFDFETYMDKFINTDDYIELINKKDDIYNKFINNDMAEWFVSEVDPKVVNKVKEVAEKIKENSDVLLVIGIGGSFMGSFSISQVFRNKYKKSNIDVIYIGNNLSADNISEVFEYIEDKDVTVDVISKSGSTFEIKTTYNLLKYYMLKKYSLDEFKKRVIVTTSKDGGYLNEEVDEYGFTKFIIPEGIGGRFTISTPAHLLPMYVQNIDIDKFLDGYYDGKKYFDDAYKYSTIRRLMFNEQKYVENFSVYEPKLYYYTEYIKQEFAESEGKDGKGVLPISTVNTRDLHSLGQFLQDGNKIVFETVIKADLGKNHEFKKYNDDVCSSVIDAHYQGGVPNIIIDLGRVSEKRIGEATMFFMMSAVCSAYLFEVNPFDQPGVENYKNILKSKILY